jgi:hypothetical protein
MFLVSRVLIGLGSPDGLLSFWLFLECGVLCFESLSGILDLWGIGLGFWVWGDFDWSGIVERGCLRPDRLID